MGFLTNSGKLLKMYGHRHLGRYRWEEVLEDDLVKFYTALYHCYQLPVLQAILMEASRVLLRILWSIKQKDSIIMMTFQCGIPIVHFIRLWPFLSPKKHSIWSNRSFLRLSREDGCLSSRHGAAIPRNDRRSRKYNDIRRYLNGITAFDAETAYKYMRQNAFDIPPKKIKKMAKAGGLKELSAIRIYPSWRHVWDAFHRYEQVSRTIEYAFRRLCSFKICKCIRKNDDYKTLIRRSENWKNVFDSKTGFVRGRYTDGHWIEPFDPYSKARFIVKGHLFSGHGMFLRIFLDW